MCAISAAIKNFKDREKKFHYQVVKDKALSCKIPQILGNLQKHTY